LAIAALAKHEGAFWKNPTIWSAHKPFNGEQEPVDQGAIFDKIVCNLDSDWVSADSGREKTSIN